MATSTQYSGQPKDYFGNVSCQTNENPSINWGLFGQPQQPKASPNYAEQQLRRREMQLRERELEARERALKQSEASPAPGAIPPPVSLSGKYGMDANGSVFINSLLDHCRSGTDIKSLPADRQQLVGIVCYAFDQGRIAEILQNRQ